MDVFGTVASAIDLVGKLVGYIQAVKGAKEDRLKFLFEVSTLGALLEVLQSRLGDTDIDGGGDDISSKLVKAGIGGPLRACYDALKYTIGGLERLVSGVNTGKLSSLTEMMRDLKWPFHREDVREMLDKIRHLKSLVSLALQTSLLDFIEKARNELAIVGLSVEGIRSTVASLEASQKAHTKKVESLQGDLISLGVTLQGAIDGITAMQNSVATIDRNQQEQERRAIINWLSAPEFDQKRITAFEKRTPGTGEWFLQHPKFTAWRWGEFNVLWCPGNPGVGKSVMTSVVIHHLQEGTVEDTAVVFIYFEYTNKDDHTMRQLVEAILSQLVQRGMSTSGMKSLQKYMGGNRPTLEELWAVLEAEVLTYARVFIVIDALDEANGQTWIPLIGRLRELPGVGILATSRDLGEIAEEFPETNHRLDVMADECDMRKYVEKRILDSTGSFKRIMKANASLRADIVAGVAEKARGMFLLAQLHMNSLETKTRVTDLRRVLAELPGDLKSAYDFTIARISDEDKPLAFRIFSWAIYAVQPMTINDLQYALAVEDGMTAIDADRLHDRVYLTSVCVGLVVLRHETYYPMEEKDNHSVGLVHYTTQEYLRNLSTHFPHPAHLAIACLRYLSFDIFKIIGPLSRTSHTELLKTPLAEYAIYCWGNHARTRYNDPIVRHLAMELLRDHQRVVTLGSLPCGAEYLSAIQLCAHFGLEHYLIDLLDDGYDINSKDSDGDTAVTQAAISGRDDILRLLLAREGVDVNPRGWNSAIPLTRAAMNGHKNVVELLLERDDVDVNWRDDSGKTPIAYAAGGGHSGVVGMLMARDNVDINSRDGGELTPLALAILWGHEAVAELLLGRDDLDTSLKDGSGDTYLIFAARHESDRIAKRLLARGNIDINSKNLRGQAALFVAALWGCDAVVKLLLGQNGIDINTTDQGGQTALSVAALWGHSAVVKLLLDQDSIDVNSKDLEGQTALHLAAAGGHDTVVKLLLGQDGIDVDSKDHMGQTALSVAVLRGRGAVIELLGQGRIDVDPVDSSGKTLLDWATSQGDLNITEILGEAGGRTA